MTKYVTMLPMTGDKRSSPASMAIPTTMYTAPMRYITNLLYHRFCERRHGRCSSGAREGSRPSRAPNHYEIRRFHNGYQREYIQRLPYRRAC